eukprot:Selendium_serpulae@DN4797_c0_g1_i1.p1
MTLEQPPTCAALHGQSRNAELTATSAAFSSQLFEMVGMCYGQGRKSEQSSVERSDRGSFSTSISAQMVKGGIRAFSSSLICVGSRADKIQRAPITEDENIPENAQGPQTIPPQLLTIPNFDDAKSAEHEEVFCDAMSTLNSSRNSLKSNSTCRTRKSKLRHVRRRPHTDLGFMTPQSLDSRLETGFQTPFCDDATLLTLTNLEDGRRAYNKMQHTLGPDQRRVRLLEMSNCLLEAAKTCVQQPQGDDCSMIYNKKGLKVWKKEFGVGRVLVRAEYITPYTPQQFSDFASNPKFRKVWDSNCEEVDHVENLAPDVHVTYTAVKRIATIYPRDTVALRIVRRLGESTEHEKNSFASCSCSVEHPAMPERSGKVRADIHLGFYVATPFSTPLGDWSIVRLFHEGDPKGWIPSSVMKMFATKVVPGSVERLLKAMADHNGVNWAEAGSGTATNYAAYLLEKHSFSMVVPVHPDSAADDVKTRSPPEPAGSPKSLTSDVGDIPFAQSVAPNVWRVE